MHTEDKKKDNKVRNILVGAAVVGAGVAAAAVLSKKENRQKIGKAFNDVTDKGKQIISDLGAKKDEVVKDFEALKSNIEMSTEKGVKELKKEVDSISTVVQEIKKSNKDNVKELIFQVRSSIKNLKKDFERLTAKK